MAGGAGQAEWPQSPETAACGVWRRTARPALGSAHLDFPVRPVWGVAGSLVGAVALEPLTCPAAALVQPQRS